MSWKVLPKGRADIPWSASVRRNKQDTMIHTHTHIHIAHKHTNTLTHTLCTSVHWRQSFSAVLTSHSRPDTSSIRSCFLSIKHLLRRGRAPEGPAPDKTHIADLTVAMQPPFPREEEKQDGQTDGRLFSMPQPRCQNSNWNQSTTCLDTVLAICRFASVYRSYSPHSV